MAAITSLVKNEANLVDYLEKDLTYFIPKLAELCLPLIIKLLMNNKYGEPLELLPFQCVMLRLMWEKKFPMILAARGAGKTFILAVYSLLKTLLIPGCKVVIVGGGFRQSKLVFGYIEEIINVSPIIQETIKRFHGAKAGVKYATDKVSLRVGETSSIEGYPVGDGSRIRGVRATVLIVDETASISESVFDVAIAPFLSVKADPAQAAKIGGVIRRLENLGASPHVIDHIRANQVEGNQLILSGTATYEFNHFFRRYQVYKMFAESGGDINKIKDALVIQNGDKKTQFTAADIARYQRTWKEYGVFQLPYSAMPPEFLEEDIIASHRATMSPTLFSQEYECKFSRDTHGFFPRSLLAAATADMGSPDEVHFEIIGDPAARYVMGIDPARWNDNFAIVILKLDGARSKVVYCESWRRTDWSKSIKRIRDLLRRFNIVHIALDQGAGGDHLSDLMANADYMEEGEYPITRFDDPDHQTIPNKVDLIELVNFHTWAKDANHAMQSDFKTKRLILPGRVDEDYIFNQSIKAANLEDAPLSDKEIFKLQVIDMIHGSIDTNDEVVSLGVVREIEAMIDEVCTIVVQVTEKGTETFGLPKLDDQAEGLDVRRRDRYSALLLGSYAARAVRGTGFEPNRLPAVGGVIQQILNSPGGLRHDGGGTHQGPTQIGGVIIP